MTRILFSGYWASGLPLCRCRTMSLFDTVQDDELKICVKCDPDKAIELRDEYPGCVEAAWHFNKKYWNTIYLNREMKDDVVRFWIRHSVEEVIKKLPKKTQTEYCNE